MASWALVATVDEPAPLVAAMVLHHLDQGASEAFLFLDRPDPELVCLLARRREVRMTLCDEGYWAATRHRMRPAKNSTRQAHNANDAYRRCSADWLLHCDADEFLLDGPRLVRDLERVPADVDLLRLPNLERAFLRERPQVDLFGGCFRRPVEERRRWIATLAYGRGAGPMGRNAAGYTIGKAFTRTKGTLRVGIHFSQARGAPEEPAPHVWASEAVVLHYEAITPWSWQVKLLRKALQLRRVEDSFDWRRRAIIRTMAQAAAGGQAAADRAAADFLALGPHQRRILRMARLLAEVDIDPAAALRREWPGIDLSPARFDAITTVRYRSEIEGSGLP